VGKKQPRTGKPSWKYMEVEISKEIYDLYQKVGKMYEISAEKLMACVLTLKVTGIPETRTRLPKPRIKSELTHEQELRLDYSMSSANRIKEIGDRLDRLDKTACIVLTPCDQGHYGSSTCSACNHNLTNLGSPSNCPGCGRKLVGTSENIISGGSDF